MFTHSRTRTSQLTGTVTTVVLAMSLSSLVLARPKHDNNSRRHGNDPDNQVFIDRGQTFGSDTGTTVRAGEANANTTGKHRGKKFDLDQVFIDRGQTFGSDTGTTFRTGEMRSSAFVRSMDLSGSHKVETNGRSSSRVSSSLVAPLAPSRAARAGRGWMDLSVDGESGLSANAGWSWSLR